MQRINLRNIFAAVSLGAIHETKKNGSLDRLAGFVEESHSSHMVRFFSFYRPMRTNCGRGYEEKNHRGESLDFYARRVPNPKGGSRGIVAEPEYYGQRVTHRAHWTKGGSATRTDE